MSLENKYITDPEDYEFESQGIKFKIVSIGKQTPVNKSALNDLLDDESFLEIRNILRESPGHVTLIIDYTSKLDSLQTLFARDTKMRVRLLHFWTLIRKIQPIFGVCYRKDRIIYLFPEKKPVEKIFRHELTHMKHDLKWKLKNLTFGDVVQSMSKTEQAFSFREPITTLKKGIGQAARNLPHERESVSAESVLPEVIIFE